MQVGICSVGTEDLLSFMNGGLTCCFQDLAGMGGKFERRESRVKLQLQQSRECSLNQRKGSMLWKMTGYGGQGGILKSTTTVLRTGDWEYGSATE